MVNKYNWGAINKSFWVMSFLVLSLGIVLASTITQISPSPTSLNTTNSSVVIEYNFTTDNLIGLNWSWDGTNYSLFDESLVLFYNLDNRSALAENDTNVTDLSGYGNDGIGAGLLVFNSTGGRYNGAFEFENYQITMSETVDNSLSSGNNFTLISWIKPRNLVGDKYILSIGGGGLGKIGLYFSTNKIMGTVTNETDELTIVGNTTLSTNWSQVILTYDGESLFLYSDGELEDQYYVGDLNYTDSWNSLGGRGSSNLFNGTIDDVRIFNRTMDLVEIKQRYVSNLVKFNESNWNLYNNQSFNETLNSTNTNYDYNYYVCVNNATEVCSSESVVTKKIPLVNLTLNYSEFIGDINPLFYGSGINTGLLNFGTAYPNQADCSDNQIVNYSDFRREFLDTNHQTVRLDMRLNKFFPSNGTINNSRSEGYVEMIEWARNNNTQVLFIAAYMPSWLQNQTSGYCNSSQWDSCPPLDYNEWGSTVLNFIDNVTLNGTYNSTISVEVWNEPYAQFWLNNLSFDHQTKADEYTKLFNATRNSIISKYPNMRVSAEIFHPTYENMSNTFLSNFSYLGNINASLHKYIETGNNIGKFNDIINATDFAFNLSNFYGVSIDLLDIGEWNLVRNIGLSHTSFHEAVISKSLTDLLSVYPSNISQRLFRFEGVYANLSCDTNNLEADYAIYSPTSNISTDILNLTKSFASICQSGGGAYSVSTNDANISTVGCNNTGQYGVILTNIGNESRNISINLSGNYPYNNITNYLTGEQFTLNEGTAELGIMDQYDILYLSSSVPPTINLIAPPNLENSLDLTLNFSANLTDDVGLNNATLNIYDSNGASSYSNTVNYVAGEKSVIESWQVTLTQGNYTWNITAWDDEFATTTSSTFNVFVGGSLGCTGNVSLTLGAVLIFVALGTVFLTFFVFYNEGIRQKITMKHIIISFMGVTLAVALVVNIADSITLFCG